MEQRRTIDELVHDMRNALCIIINNLELLRDVSAPEMQKLILRAIGGADRGTIILNELSALNRIEKV